MTDITQIRNALYLLMATDKVRHICDPRQVSACADAIAPAVAELIEAAEYAYYDCRSDKIALNLKSALSKFSPEMTGQKGSGK